VTRADLRLYRHRSCQYVTLEHRRSRCPVVLIRLVRDTGQHPRKAHSHEALKDVGPGRDEMDVGVRSSNCGVA
jgi:hypothetical protein